MKVRLAGWGNYPKVSSNLISFKSQEDLLECLESTNSRVLARGGGTSYGDASLSEMGKVIEMNSFNKIFSFDSEDGVLHCQSGVVLGEVVRRFLPMGWCLNVTPGTQNATIGGCIACDAHGKNWGAGAFSNHVISFSLAIPGKGIFNCDRIENSDLFFSTTGGVGLTGVILDVKIRLKKIDSAIMEVETIPFCDFNECISLQYDSMESHEYVFCWLDSLASGKKMGRGVLQRANHKNKGSNDSQNPSKKVLSVPFYMPSFTINRLSVAVFNKLYFKMTKSNKKNVYFTDFFYPLDGIHHWNKLYGHKGFIEYQIAIPYKNSEKYLREIMREIVESKLGSFIAAIKPIGKSEGLISFPMEGFTLAVDFAFNPRVFNLLEKLDEICIHAGGRAYLSKDSRTSATSFSKMYSTELDLFNKILQKYDLKSRIGSSLADRLSI